jgi:hypothetical protein
MCPANQIQVMFLGKRCDNVCSKRESGTTVIRRPSIYAAIGIAPEHIGQYAWVVYMYIRDQEKLLTFLRNLRRAHNPTDLVHGLQVRTKPTMHRYYPLADDSGDWKTIEAV